MQIYESPLDDYMECVINFGFVVLFSSSFMLCPLLCIILLLVEIRVDAWKLTNLTRRPFPEQASSIGIWLEILQGLAITGVISNTGIIVFTATIFDTDAK